LAAGEFVRGEVVEVDGTTVTLASGQQFEPDFLILASGSAYPFPAKTEERTADGARVRLREAHATLLGAERVLIVGAGPAGLELAGEIKAFYPDKHVTVADISDDVLEGPYAQELRDELRRQLDALGVELKLGSTLLELPAAAPATAAEIAVRTDSGEMLTADVWYRCFGVVAHAQFLRGTLGDARDSAGYVRVDDQLRVIGQDRVFAIGDISDADRDMAGIATAQAKLTAANVRALIAGAELTAYERFPAVIAVPLGPEGGAGQLPGADGIAGPEVIAELKGRTMLIDHYAALFDVAPPARAA
jgi:NADH dehydrogenase FAD-containing subunit